MVKKFFTGENFWVQVSELSNVEPFRSLYLSDNGGERSSKIMWGIALCYDYDSRLWSLEESERLELIKKDVWGEDLDDKLIKDLKEGYLFLQRDSVKRYLYELDLKLDERREFIRGLRYDDDNWEKLDKLLLSTEKLFTQREAIRKMTERKEEESLRGDIKPSLLERNEI